MFLNLNVLLLIFKASSFWMLYGGKKFADEDNEITGNCTDVDSAPENCRVIKVKDMESYHKLLFFLWTATFGRDFDREVVFFVLINFIHF